MELGIPNENENEKGRALRKTRIGKVIGDRMDKTIVVAIEMSVKHSLYKKIIKRTY
ncbi:MAG: 30S ribosomal protein S17, partial [Synergistaceae bacterium]|nr:30S ribosomal protein S17 [Synergistaceae bacterium]